MIFKTENFIEKQIYIVEDHETHSVSLSVGLQSLFVLIIFASFFTVVNSWCDISLARTVASSSHQLLRAAFDLVNQIARLGNVGMTAVLANIFAYSDTKG